MQTVLIRVLTYYLQASPRQLQLSHSKIRYARTSKVSKYCPRTLPLKLALVKNCGRFVAVIVTWTPQGYNC